MGQIAIATFPTTFFNAFAVFGGQLDLISATRRTPKFGSRVLGVIWLRERGPS